MPIPPISTPATSARSRPRRAPRGSSSSGSNTCSEVIERSVDQVLLHDLVVTSAAVGDASSRLAKIGERATLLRRLSPEEGERAIAFLSGAPGQGGIGRG